MTEIQLPNPVVASCAGVSISSSELTHAKAVLLEGGLIVDGSGGPAFTADLLLLGDRIARIGQGLRRQLTQDLVIEEIQMVDCRGQVVAPGFIDAHTHDDAIVLLNPDCTPKVSQGITTVITGNCGISLAPYCAPVAKAPLSLLGERSFHFDSFAAYADAVNAAQPALNVAALVGHTTLRFAVMKDLTRAARSEECAQMKQLLEACMTEGAFGMSTGLFYEEAFAAPAEEVTDLARVVARHGGVYASHLRSEMASIIEAMHEAGDSAFQAGLPLVLSHHKCAGPAQWGRTRETLPLVDELARRQEIAMDVYPYVAGSTVLREDLVDGVIDVMLTWSDTHPEHTGRMLSAIAQEWSVDQKTACRRLQPGGACYFQMNEEDVERVIAHPRTMIGSDGLPHDRHPHPRLWGTFPRVFARYWRERKLFSLEQTVHKMTGLTAKTFRIHNRGQLRVGAMADVVVFDAQRIKDLATYDEPTQVSEGITAVYVNGVLAYAETVGPQVLARAGRMLKRGQCN